MTREGDTKLGPTVDSPNVLRPTDEAVPRAPGLVAIFANRQPTLRIFRAEREPLTLGRLELSEGDELDSAISREHARFVFDDDAWQVTDLGSRNGTYVNGRAV